VVEDTPILSASEM